MNMRKISIPAEFINKKQLISFWAENLLFPSYWASNWDSFREILLGEDFGLEGKIEIIHTNLPDMDKKDRDIYVSVLKSIILDKANFETSRLKITLGNLEAD